MGDLKYLYFSCLSSNFTFAIAPFMWFVILFEARLKRRQIIKSILFILMYGYFVISAICLLTLPPESVFPLVELTLFLSCLAPILWIILLTWNIGDFFWIIRKKVKSEKAQKRKTDFIVITALQIVLLSTIVPGWCQFMKQLFWAFA